MLRTTLITLVALCGMDARSPAQVHVGLTFGKHASVHASVRSNVRHRVSPNRHYTTPNRRASRHVLTSRTPRRVSRRLVDTPRRGHYRWVTRRVWSPGYYSTIQVPAQYQTVCGPRGRERVVLVSSAYTRRVWNAGRWSRERQRVWVAY